MEVFQARLDSFLKAKRVKGSSGSILVKWPHPPHFPATPNTLAEAGFYSQPSWEERDAVKCFMCSKELSDWQEEDDPFTIHWQKCRTSCPWAILRCGLQNDLDQDGNFVSSDPTRLPTSENLRKARLKTFTSWPHDSDPSHGATSERMALAGFVYTPQSLGDDTAACLYCNVALSGWEIGDDPLQEHRKRDKKSRTRCPFLSVETVVPTIKAAPRSRSRKPKKEAVTNTGNPTPSTSAVKSNKEETTTTAIPTPSTSAVKSNEEETTTTAVIPLSTGTVKSNKEKTNTPASPPSASPVKPSNEGTTSTVIPPLSTSPVQQIVSVTEDILNMTVEEWIRHEMSLQYDNFKADGERMISLFKERTTEVRRTIQAL